MKDRAKWQKETYSKFWTNQVTKYGFDSYCKGLFEMIQKKKPSKVYELAIGTGWPFAINFQKQGVQVSGSDIAELLIEGIHSQYPEINANVASYEDLNSLETGQYDVVYCFRSTWYFPDVIKAIDAMLKLSKKPGWVIFDIMNKDSIYIQRLITFHRLSIPFTIFKNLSKLILNFFFKKNYIIQHLWKLPEIPVSPIIIENYLNSQSVLYKKYFINEIEGEAGSPSKITVDSKIVFECEIL